MNYELLRRPTAERRLNKPYVASARQLNGKQALIWIFAFAISVLALAYQLQGGVTYVHVEALEGLLGLDGLFLLIIAISPRSNVSLFSKVRNNEWDFGMITILLFLSALLMINGLFDLVQSKDRSGLIAGIGVTPGEGVTTLLGILFLLIAVIALFLLLVSEFLSRNPRINSNHSSGVAASQAVAPRAAVLPTIILQRLVPLLSPNTQVFFTHSFVSG